MNDQTKQAMLMALEVLECLYDNGLEDTPVYKHDNAITALRLALAQPQGEPVAGSPSWEAFDIAIEAMRIETLEKAAKVCEEIYNNDDMTQQWLEDAAAAIRSMK